MVCMYMCLYVIFAGLYYKMDGAEKLARFLENAERYVPPQAPYELPPPELLPRRRTAAEAKQMFPKPIELRGYCPVTYLEGNCRSVNHSRYVQ